MLIDRRELDKEAARILVRIAERPGEAIPVYVGEESVLRKLTGFALTRGCLCAMERRELPSVQEIVQNASRIAVLEEVVNPTNVGAIFRSAAALGMDAVLLTHGCSDPLYRRAIRVSMGTVFQIPWTFIGSRKEPGWPQPGLSLLRELGFKTAAMALKKDSVTISDPALTAEPKLAVVLGTEGDGLSGETIAGCDYTVMIPMFHGVDSLNVAAASAVAFWQLGSRPGA
jgi:tRNA G18 (ribose-2'-O)-methylase SpoU